jgi:PleD family two-component response regulator
MRLSGVKIDIAGQAIPLSFSAGWANYIPGESADELLKRADEALYANKRGEKNRHELSIPVQ